MADLELRAPDGARARISLHGGQLMSWHPAGDDERLYASPLSHAAPGQALRGGVPVIFPQFAAQGPGPRHGIARSRAWSVVQHETGRDDALAVLRLADDAATRAAWPHAFALELTVRIGGNLLEMELAVDNLGDHAFDFQAALHSYWRVDDARRVAVEGLRDRAYQDAATGASGVQHSQRLEVLRDNRPIDRIVQGPAQAAGLIELSERGRRLLIEPEGFDDLVVWNPGPGHGLTDLPVEDWQRFVCLEVARIAHPVHLPPGTEWLGRQRVTAA